MDLNDADGGAPSSDTSSALWRAPKKVGRRSKYDPDAQGESRNQFQHRASRGDLIENNMADLSNHGERRYCLWKFHNREWHGQGHHHGGSGCLQRGIKREVQIGRLQQANLGGKTAYGIALNGASDGQPRHHPLQATTINAVLTAGAAYYLSETAGGIQPVADLGTGNMSGLIGVAKSTTVLSVRIVTRGYTLMADLAQFEGLAKAQDEGD